MLLKNHLQRRDRERKELRLRILEAARSLFTQGGEERVTLRRVAEKIEFSATTIYLHFPDKEALVQELCKGDFAFFSRSLEQADRLPDAMERLRKIATLYLDFGLQYPEQYRVLFMRVSPALPAAARPKRPEASGQYAAASGPAIGANPSTEIAKEMNSYDHLHRAVFKAMAAGCFKPEYRDVALLAQSIWSCLHGVIALHLVRTQHADVFWKPVQSIMDTALECLFNGLTIPACQLSPTWRRAS